MDNVVMEVLNFLSSISGLIVSAAEEDDCSARQNSGSRTNSMESTETNLLFILGSFEAKNTMNSLNVPHWAFSGSLIFKPISARLIAGVGNEGFVYWSSIRACSFWLNLFTCARSSSMSVKSGMVVCHVFSVSSR